MIECKITTPNVKAGNIDRQNQQREEGQAVVINESLSSETESSADDVMANDVKVESVPSSSTRSLPCDTTQSMETPGELSCTADDGSIEEKTTKDATQKNVLDDVTNKAEIVENNGASQVSEAQTGNKNSAIVETNTVEESLNGGIKQEDSKVKEPAEGPFALSEGEIKEAENIVGGEEEHALADMVKQFLEIDATEIQRENDEASRYMDQVVFWANCKSSLTDAVRRLQTRFKERLVEHGAREPAFSVDVKEALADRKEGIELCGRMIDRFAQFLADEEPPKHVEDTGLLGPLVESDLLDVQSGEALESLKAHFSNKQKERRIHNYKVVSVLRNAAEDAQNKLKNAITRQLLPVVDGLDEGKRISVSLQQELADKYVDEEENVTDWFTIYDDLIEAILGELLCVQIRQLSINQGDTVDYEYCEPLDVEEDQELGDETVKEVIRRGFVISGAAGCQEQLLRAGQVIVVKNPSQESE